MERGGAGVSQPRIDDACLTDELPVGDGAREAGYGGARWCWGGWAEGGWVGRAAIRPISLSSLPSLLHPPTHPPTRHANRPTCAP